MTGIHIVGSGHTAFGRLDARSLEDLIVEATREALSEAGISGKDIDAVYLGHFNAGMSDDGFASSLIHQADDQLRFKPATRIENACASGSGAVYAGMDAILAGRAKRVLVVGVEKMTHRSTPEVTASLGRAGYQGDPSEAGLSFPQVFAIAAKAYAERYSDPMEAMARISSKNHKNALANPLAQMRRDLSFEQCNEVTEKNPLIAPPLRLSDCSLISDGAAAVVLSADPAAHARSAHIRAAAHVSDFLPMSRHDILRFEGPKRAVAQAYAEAGIKVDDVGFAEVHDCFTIAELLMYEALGLCDAGQGATVLADGSVYRGGRLPVNLSGGLKAKGHPVGATGVSMHALSFRQLTGTAGEMQVDAPRLGVVVNMGGAAVANYATVLETGHV
ncbi:MULTISPECIES: thiolase domain-containing protein [Roseobacteraceae]|uniref:thiolase domain-containing protein n=1 Tax=Roseobacteraceae TaxID=2854170 RepID=UPI00125FD5B6|nr:MULTISPECIES: thiolase domain-containing protein [Roseobacteraceae]KAB6715481.1 acetyl-CoA acetyltransferase [Roseobacter sp. TSBP12]